MTTRFDDLVDLAAERLGGAVVSANDESTPNTSGKRTSFPSLAPTARTGSPQAGRHNDTGT